MPVLSIYVSEKTLETLWAFSKMEGGSRSPVTLAEDAVEETALRARLSIPELDLSTPCPFSG